MGSGDAPAPFPAVPLLRDSAVPAPACAAEIRLALAGGGGEISSRIVWMALGHLPAVFSEDTEPGLSDFSCFSWMLARACPPALRCRQPWGAGEGSWAPLGAGVGCWLKAGTSARAAVVPGKVGGAGGAASREQWKAGSARKLEMPSENEKKQMGLGVFLPSGMGLCAGSLAFGCVSNGRELLAPVGL